ncbi:purine phosphorylase [Pelagibius sp. CAU 1746]|uniref:phosphorylase family protein n=1 Tax=Pelagibius sp. CAU 1746 TaxID=3140370 RepID=UPI00325B282B
MAPAPQAATSRKIGVVTGLASESEIAAALLADATLEAEVLCAGASAARAAERSAELIANGCQALLSFGIAGALAGELDCGDLIVAHGLRDPEGTDYITDAAWRGQLVAAMQDNALLYREGAILGSPRTLRNPADKAAAFADSGCLAVDMESVAVAGAAAEAGLPFLAVRAIADRAKDSLPALVENAVKPDGRPDVARALAALLRRPAEIPATLRLARQTELALARLRMLEDVKEVLFGRF